MRFLGSLLIYEIRVVYSKYNYHFRANDFWTAVVINGIDWLTFTKWNLPRRTKSFPPRKEMCSCISFIVISTFGISKNFTFPDCMNKKWA